MTIVTPISAPAFPVPVLAASAGERADLRFLHFFATGIESVGNLWEGPPQFPRR